MTFLQELTAVFACLLLETMGGDCHMCRVKPVLGVSITVSNVC